MVSWVSSKIWNILLGPFNRQFLIENSEIRLRAVRVFKIFRSPKTERSEAVVWFYNYNILSFNKVIWLFSCFKDVLSFKWAENNRKNSFIFNTNLFIITTIWSRNESTTMKIKIYRKMQVIVKCIFWNIQRQIKTVFCSNHCRVFRDSFEKLRTNWSSTCI